MAFPLPARVFPMQTATDLQIRPYQSADEEAVVNLWKRCRLIRPDNDPQRDIAMKMEWQPDLLLVGEADGRVAATAMVGYEGHRGWINYLGVDPDFQHRGYGRAMMKAAEARLREVGCVKVNLCVRLSNQKVVGFYEDLGYNRQPVVMLGKKL